MRDGGGERGGLVDTHRDEPGGERAFGDAHSSRYRNQVGEEGGARDEDDNDTDDQTEADMPLARRRMRRAAVIGPAPVARTAAAVGTAAVVAHGVNRRMDRRDDRRDRRR